MFGCLNTLRALVFLCQLSDDGETLQPNWEIWARTGGANAGRSALGSRTEKPSVLILSVLKVDRA